MRSVALHKHSIVVQAFETMALVGKLLTKAKNLTPLLRFRRQASINANHSSGELYIIATLGPRALNGATSVMAHIKSISPGRGGAILTVVEGLKWRARSELETIAQFSDWRRKCYGSNRMIWSGQEMGGRGGGVR